MYLSRAACTSCSVRESSDQFSRMGRNNRITAITLCHPCRLWDTTMLEAVVLSSLASRVWPMKRVNTCLFLTLGRRDCPLLGEWSPAQCHAGSVLWGRCSIPLGKHWGWHWALLEYSGCREWHLPCKRIGQGPSSQPCKGLLEQEPTKTLLQVRGSFEKRLAQERSLTAPAGESVCSQDLSAASLFPGAAGLHQLWNHCCAEEGLGEDQESESWGGWHFQMEGSGTFHPGHTALPAALPIRLLSSWLLLKNTFTAWSI